MGWAGALDETEQRDLIFSSEGRLTGEAFSLIDTCDNESHMIYLTSGYSYFLKKKSRGKIRNKKPSPALSVILGGSANLSAAAHLSETGIRNSRAINSKSLKVASRTKSWLQWWRCVKVSEHLYARSKCGHIPALPYVPERPARISTEEQYLVCKWY